MKTSGFKTYAIAVLTALGAVGAFLNDSLDVSGLIAALLASAAMAGLRHGVKTEVEKLKGE